MLKASALQSMRVDYDSTRRDGAFYSLLALLKSDFMLEFADLRGDIQRERRPLVYFTRVSNRIDHDELFATLTDLRKRMVQADDLFVVILQKGRDASIYETQREKLKQRNSLANVHLIMYTDEAGAKPVLDNHRRQIDELADALRRAAASYTEPGTPRAAVQTGPPTSARESTSPPSQRARESTSPPTSARSSQIHRPSAARQTPAAAPSSAPGAGAKASLPQNNRPAAPSRQTPLAAPAAAHRTHPDRPPINTLVNRAFLYFLSA